MTLVSVGATFVVMRMSLLSTSITVGLLVGLWGCAEHEEASMPSPVDTTVFVTEITGTVDAAAGTITFGAVAGTSSGLVNIPVVQDGTANSGTADTVELNTVEVSFDDGLCGGANIFCGRVELNSFFDDETLETPFVEFVRITPATGNEAVNSDPVPPGSGLSDALALFAYNNVGPGGTDEQLWAFPDAGQAFTFVARVRADISCPMGFSLVADRCVADAPDGLLAIDADHSDLHTISTADGASLSSVTITMPGFAVNGGHGLARDPTDGTLFAIIKADGSRHLATLDETTGVATQIGALGDAFAGIQFDAAGQLFGVTGHRANTSESLFTINKTAASSMLLTALGNGNDGETIGFNPNDSLMYHASGREGSEIFETVDLGTMAITGIPGFNNTDETISLLFDTSDGAFFGTTIEGELVKIQTDGSFTVLGSNLPESQIKGLEFQQ